jgi:hypothetical protein
MLISGRRVFSSREAEIRRRLWATIMELNVQASLDAGMPPNISLDDFDTEPPSNINDTDIDDRTEDIMQSPKTIITDAFLQRLLIGYIRPRLQILRIMNGVNLEMTQAEVIALTSEINTACHECSAYVKSGPGAEGKGAVFRQNLADLFLRRFLLSLHRPWASRARASPLLYFSRRISYDSATALLSPQQDEGFSRILMRGSGMFKNRMIHVSLALASELLIEIEEKGASSFIQEPWNYGTILIAAVQEARRQSAQRMRFGETNVRLHMKLSIVLSQAEGFPPGQSLQERMIQSAKDSLEMSYATIRAHLGLPAASLHGDGTPSMTQECNQMGLSPNFDIDDILQTTEFALDEAFASTFWVQP